MRVLYIIRGLPGSGKSSLGEDLINHHWASGGKPGVGIWMRHCYSADDWFTDKKGNYNFVPEELPQAHEDCQLRVQGAMLDKVERIAVCNTFTQAWEAERYFELCKIYDYSPFVIQCQNDFGNIHGCSDDKIEEMRERWDENIWVK